MWMNVMLPEGKFSQLSKAKKDTSTHISDWFDVVQKTGLSDDALINHLYDSLRPAIVSHIQNCVIIRQPLPIDIASYLVKVRVGKYTL